MFYVLVNNLFDMLDRVTETVIKQLPSKALKGGKSDRSSKDKHRDALNAAKQRSKFAPIMNKMMHRIGSVVDKASAFENKQDGMNMVTETVLKQLPAEGRKRAKQAIQDLDVVGSYDKFTNGGNNDRECHCLC